MVDTTVLDFWLTFVFWNDSANCEGNILKSGANWGVLATYLFLGQHWDNRHSRSSRCLWKNLWESLEDLFNPPWWYRWSISFIWCATCIPPWMWMVKAICSKISLIYVQFCQKDCPAIKAPITDLMLLNDRTWWIQMQQYNQNQNQNQNVNV